MKDKPKYRRNSAAAFDSAYFRKYYFDAATRVTTTAEMRGRALLIAAILRHAGIPVRSILDTGCGTAACALSGSRDQRLSMRPLPVDPGLGGRLRAALAQRSRGLL